MSLQKLLLAAALLATIEGRGHARGCIDPNDCSSTNGHGIYFEEQGSLLEGSAQLDATSHAMITHFINNGSSVSFQARFYVPSSGVWTSGNGYVYAADYGGNRYTVSYVYVYAPSTSWPTYLYWLLTDSAGHSFWVGGSGLYNLALHLFTPNQSSYTITFSPVSGSAFPESGVHGTKVYQYDLVVHPGDGTSGGSAQYCMRANGVADSVVFQGGIDVDPVNGAVASASSHVTMSCRHGAIAQSYLWGYDYIADSWHFGGAIHMKRASYCGDGSYFTNAGTGIAMLDDEGIEIGSVSDANLEALWTPAGASCYVPSNMRHPELRFDGTCLGKPSIPVCSSTALQSMRAGGAAFLADSKSP